MTDSHSAAESASNTSDDAVRHTFLARVFAVLGLIAVGLTVWYTSHAFVLIFAGILFAIVLRRLAAGVQRYTSFGDAASLAVVVVALLVVGFLTTFFLGYSIYSQIADLATSLQSASRSLLDKAEQNGFLGRVLSEMPSPAKLMSDQMASVSSVGSLLLTPVGFVVNLLFIFFTGLFLAAAPDAYVEGVTRLFPVDRRDRVREVLGLVGENLWWWSLARVFCMAVTGLLVGIGMALLGIPMPVAIGVLTAILVFIPNIGAFLAVIPPLLLSVQQGGLMPLWVLVVYTGVQLIESYLLTPIVQQRQTDLPPAYILAVQLLAGVLLGLIGVTFATPLGLAALLLIRELYVRDMLEKPSPLPT